MNRIFRAGLVAVVVCLVLLRANAYAFDSGTLRDAVMKEEKRIGARIGVAMLDTKDGASFEYRGSERFPINSTHKAFLCGALLQQVDNRILSLADTAVIHEGDLVTYSPVTEKYLAPKTITYSELCRAAVSYSDNTAANVIVDKIGGVAAFNRFMQSLGDSVTRMDRKEPEINEGIPGDLRDTTTPSAAAASLNAMFFGTILSADSAGLLVEWMKGDAVANALLRKSLPAGWSIADKTGAGGNGSRSIIAVVYPAGKSPWVVSIYIAETKATMAERNESIARLGQVLFPVMQ
ncbi:MAG: class A beta-lactamase [Halodesulfovibrio sp.]